LARQLRAAGHLIYVAREIGLERADDEVHLVNAAELGAVLASQNQKHFEPLHHAWQAQGRPHAGILTTHQVDVGAKIERLERAARLLTAETAHNQLMKLSVFATEEQGRLFVLSLTV
jgi:hypothetical protein